MREGNGIETYAGTSEKYVGSFLQDVRNGQVSYQEENEKSKQKVLSLACIYIRNMILFHYKRCLLSNQVLQ